MDLQSLNLSGAYIFGSIVFGAIGMGAFVYGKRTGRWQALIIGVALMAYPYFISSTMVLCLIGAALTAALFLFRD
ncbi:MAG: hypothetical protein ABI443_07695 [Chthoniobacterales bacterium]